MQRGTGKQKIKLGTRLRIKIRTISAHRTATVERFSPTLLAHAIATQTHRDTKAMARAKPTHKISKPLVR